MPLRKTLLVNGEYYHVFNRGVARQPIFKYKKDYERFIHCLTYYSFNSVNIKLSRLLTMKEEDRSLVLSNLYDQNDKRVEILAFVLMPNHFHMLLQQRVDGGISHYIKLVTDSYIRYFNTKHNRVGPLFQGAFKAVRIESNEQLLHVSRYIHLNPLVSYIVTEENLLSYPWSTLPVYLQVRSDNLINTKLLLGNFKDVENYKSFIFDHVDYARSIDTVKHLVFD